MPIAIAYETQRALAIRDAGDEEERDDQHRVHPAAEAVDDADHVLGEIGLHALGPREHRPRRRTSQTSAVTIAPISESHERAAATARARSAARGTAQRLAVVARLGALQDREQQQAGEAPEDDVPRRRLAAEERELVDVELLVDPEPVDRDDRRRPEDREDQQRDERRAAA